MFQFELKREDDVIVNDQYAINTNNNKFRVNCCLVFCVDSIDCPLRPRTNTKKHLRGAVKK